MAGFISERVAGFKLECLAGFVGIRNQINKMAFAALEQSTFFMLVERRAAVLAEHLELGLR